MHTPYGEIQGTCGLDETHLDVYINEGGLESSTEVYVIGIVKKGSDQLDEEKVFLGYQSKEEVLRDFANHYDHAQYFGYIASLPVDTFVRRCHEPVSASKSLIPQACTRAKLGRRQMQRDQSLRAERDEWLQSMVAKARNVRETYKGLSFEEIEEKIEALGGREESPETAYELSLLEYARYAAMPKEVAKALPMEDNLYIRIWPGRDAIDLQNEIIPVDLIYKSWEYYVQCGNIDLEHISKSGGKTWREKAAKVEAAGFDPELGAKMRIQYEIGRPVQGSLRIEKMDEDGYVTDFSFVARIYGGENEAAKWFRSTLPYIPWKPSIGGQMSAPVEVIVHNEDAMLGINRTQKTRVARDFRWNNVAMTLEPCNHTVKEVHILSPDEIAELKKDVPNDVDSLKA